MSCPWFRDAFILIFHWLTLGDFWLDGTLLNSRAPLSQSEAAFKFWKALLARSNSFKIEINGTNESLNNSSTTLPNIVSGEKNDLRKKDDPLCGTPLPKYSKTSLGNLGTLKNHSWDNHNLRTPKPTSKIWVEVILDGPTDVNWKWTVLKFDKTDCSISTDRLCSVGCLFSITNINFNKILANSHFGLLWTRPLKFGQSTGCLLSRYGILWQSDDVTWQLVT